MERTLIIIKPDAVISGKSGKILLRFENENFKIKALSVMHLSKDKAAQLYKIHEGKPFFRELVDFIASYSVVAFVLEGESAIERARRIIGATNPKEADKDTLRSQFGSDITRNAVHASDSKEAYEWEVEVLFGKVI